MEDLYVLVHGDNLNKGSGVRLPSGEEKKRAGFLHMPGRPGGSIGGEKESVN